MQHYYYMNAAGEKDGPHDLVTIMRRINAGKIQPDSWVFVGEEADATPAHRVEDLRLFFNKPLEDVRQELGQQPHISLLGALRQGSAFVSEHQTMAVFAGAILLFSALFGMLLQEMFNQSVIAVIGAWMMFFVLQSYYLVVSLRVYRGQNIDIGFIEHSLAPIGTTLIVSSMLFALLSAAGAVLLVVPGVLAMLAYAFVPMRTLDYASDTVRSMRSAMTLLRKLDQLSLINLGLILLLYVAGVALLFPIPLVMPLLAGALCTIYEEVSAI